MGVYYFEWSFNYVAGLLWVGAVQAIYVFPLALLARRLILR